MCEPTTIMTAAAITNAAISTGSAIAEADARDEQAEDTRERAREAALQRYKDLGRRQAAVQDRKTRTIAEAESQVEKKMALERLSQGESGVTGISAKTVLDSMEKEAAEFKVGVERQTERQLDALQLSKQTAEKTKSARVESARGSNPFATALQIGQAGVRAGLQIASQKAATPDTG